MIRNDQECFFDCLTLLIYKEVGALYSGDIKDKIEKIGLSEQEPNHLSSYR